MHSASTAMARCRGDAELPKVSVPGCKLLLLCPHVVTKHFLAILLKKEKKRKEKSTGAPVRRYCPGQVQAGCLYLVCFRIDFFLLDNIFLLNPGSKLFNNVALWLLLPTPELEASTGGDCTVLRVL